MSFLEIPSVYLGHEQQVEARGPNSSKKTDVLESSQDIVHQSAMSLVPEVLYPEMGYE